MILLQRLLPCFHPQFSLNSVSSAIILVFCCAKSCTSPSLRCCPCLSSTTYDCPVGSNGGASQCGRIFYTAICSCPRLQAERRSPHVSCISATHNSILSLEKHDIVAVVKPNTKTCILGSGLSRCREKRMRCSYRHENHRQMTMKELLRLSVEINTISLCHYSILQYHQI